MAIVKGEPCLRSGSTKGCLQGGKWEPHAHFTGSTDDHADKLVAFYDYNPLRGMYSVELQFESDEAGRDCRAEFSKLFTPTGKLKKRYRKGNGGG